MAKPEPWSDVIPMYLPCVMEVKSLSTRVVSDQRETPALRFRSPWLRSRRRIGDKRAVVSGRNDNILGALLWISLNHSDDGNDFPSRDSGFRCCSPDKGDRGKPEKKSGVETEYVRHKFY